MVVTQEVDVRHVAGRADVVRVWMELRPAVVAVMVKRGPRSRLGAAPAMVTSVDALPPVVAPSEAPPVTAADPWAVLIAVSVVSMSAQGEIVALNNGVLTKGVLTIVVLEIAGLTTAVLTTVVLMNAAQRIAGLVTGAPVAVASQMVKLAACAQDVQTVRTSVLTNNPALRPVLTAQRVSRMICSGGVMPPRRHWKPVGPSIASGAPVRCGALPNSWRCCAMRKRLESWWRKSPGHVWLR